MILKFFKGKTVIFVSLLTLIAGGVGGFFIGKNQATSSQPTSPQQMQNRFGGNGKAPDSPNGGTDANAGASANSGSSSSNDSNTSANSASASV
ncbi:hypothetical protein [Lactococcus kimchii]|uniref:hypothetical protein n=1 Tax=Lactococcus sp. S-13 TaxID=2507158 RepID=UPI001CC1F031|nr:hypothetical protein [Lactococcus sp. S-13]